MTMPVQQPVFPPAPKEYDQQYMQDVLRTLTAYIRLQNAIGPIVASEVMITQLPTSSVGLRVGTLYNDSGTVKVVV